MHKLKLSLALLSTLFALGNLAYSQRAPGDRKTIEISATEKVEITAEIATLKIGYQNQADTKDAAYAENTRTANKIIEAILAAGVPKGSIETETLNLAQQDQRYFEKSTASAKFSASQQWRIRSKASEAQKIIDIAVAAGANEIENVEWSVVDPGRLEAKAHAAALKRARDLAEQTASQSGLKLGEIISIVNSANPRFLIEAADTSVASVAAPKNAMLKLQLGTVERDASVTVTYAIVP